MRHRTLTVLVLAFALAACGDSGRAAKMQAIGELRAATDEEYQLLLDRLENGNREERGVAAWALGQVGRISAVPALQRTLADDGESLDVRLNACGALGQFEGEEVQSALVAALEEDDVQLQGAALRALARPEFSGAADAVADVLAAGNPDLKSLAVEALSEMLDPQNLAVFERVAREESEPEVRAVAIFSLGKLRDPSAIPTLTQLLEDKAWEVRANAVQALAMIGDHSVIPTIRGMLDDEHTQVQLAAERALERLEQEAQDGGG